MLRGYRRGCGEKEIFIEQVVPTKSDFGSEKLATFQLSYYQFDSKYTS